MTFIRLSALLLSLVLVLGLPGPVLAQDGASVGAGAPPDAVAIDYDAWNTDATRAENIIAAGTASTAFLTNLRATLVGWRARFLEGQSANATRIDTIQAQINALGPPPAEGASEPVAIADRRAQLADQLAEAQVPRVTATEAFNRANGLIGEIDAILAARQARALLERDPAPVNPLHWGTALSALGDVALVLNREIENRIEALRLADQSPWDRLPFAGLLALIALALLTRSRYFVGRWTDRLQVQVGVRRGRIALAFLVSLLQVLLPMIGLVVFGAAMLTVDILGTSGTALLSSGIGVFVSIFAALWLAGRLFPVNEDAPGALGAPVDLRPALRRAVVTVGIFLGLGGFAETFSTLDAVPLEARGIFVLPVYLGLAWGFYRLAALIRRVRRAELAGADAEETSPDTGFAGRSHAIIGQLLRLVAVG